MLLQDSQILVQLIGFVGLGLSVLAFQFNKRSSILKLQTFAALMYTVHFFLLGAFTGSGANAITALRNHVYQKTGKRWRTWLIPTFFGLVFLIVGVLTWQGWLTLLPIVSSLGGVVAYWQSSPRVIRSVELLLGPPLWIIYNIASHSYPGIILEIFLLTSTLVGIYRFDIRKVRLTDTKQKALKNIA